MNKKCIKCAKFSEMSYTGTDIKNEIKNRFPKRFSSKDIEDIVSIMYKREEALWHTIDGLLAVVSSTDEFNVN